MLREREVELGQDWKQTGSGLLIPSTANTRTRPIGIDLFCGCGGFSLGMMQGGFDVVLALDNDPTCALTYMYNFGAYPCQFHFVTDDDKQRMEDEMQREIKRQKKEAGKSGIYKMPVSGGNAAWKGNGASHAVGHFVLGDARQVTGQQILGWLGMQPGEIDCVFGGPPCQGFSRMGRRQVMDPRNSLLFEFARLVCEIQPKTIVMENVPDVVTMTTPEGVPVLDAFCMILETGGMGTFEALRRSLGANAGAGAIVKGKPKPAKAAGKRERARIKKAAISATPNLPLEVEA